jgi:hypothetical protein
VNPARSLGPALLLGGKALQQRGTQAARGVAGLLYRIGALAAD